MDKLYALPADHFRTVKILFAAALSGKSLQVLCKEPEFVFGQTNRTDEFLAKFPLGKVPALESSDGKVALSESNAIAYYVSNEQLRGKSPEDAALVQQWVNFADNEILPSACTWVFPTIGMTQYNKAETEMAKEHLKKCLNVLNVYLTSRTYLVGQRITLADVALACNMRMMYMMVLEPSFRQPYTNVTRWFETIVNHPEFVKIVSETKLCEKMAQPDAKKYAELHQHQTAKGGKGDQGGAKGGKKEAKMPPPKKEKEEEKPAAAAAVEPKEEDPLAKAPKGTFDFDAFKRCFSNEDTETKAIPHLWEHFDAENYSIYHAVYKYKEDNVRAFMTTNLSTGMLQRVEKLRKHAFGLMYVLGKDKKGEHNIEGLWIFRGQKVAFELSENWNVDAPSFDFYKMDPNNQEHKDLVSSFLLAAPVGSYKFPPEEDIQDYQAFK